jgi:hypothetical protein
MVASTMHIVATFHVAADAPAGILGRGTMVARA